MARIPIYVHSELGALPADLWEVYFVRRGLGWVMVLAGAAFMVVDGARALVASCAGPSRSILGGRERARAGPDLRRPSERSPSLLVGLGGSALVARYLAAWVDRRQPDGGQPASARGATAAGCVLHRGPRRPRADRAADPRPDSRRSSTWARAHRRSRSARRRAGRAGSRPRQRSLQVPVQPPERRSPLERRSLSRALALPRRLGGRRDGAKGGRSDAWCSSPRAGTLRSFEDTNVRARGIPFAPGDQVSLPGFEIAVRRVTPDGRPQEVAYQFDRSLEDPSLRWLVWQDGAYRSVRATASGRGCLAAGPALRLGGSPSTRTGEVAVIGRAERRSERSVSLLLLLMVAHTVDSPRTREPGFSFPLATWPPSRRPLARSPDGRGRSRWPFCFRSRSGFRRSSWASRRIPTRPTRRRSRSISCHPWREDGPFAERACHLTRWPSLC